MRIIRIPWTERWLSRFNKRFAIDKSSYDGRFKSRLGIGYCSYVGDFSVMEYTFIDLPAKGSI